MIGWRISNNLAFVWTSAEARERRGHKTEPWLGLEKKPRIRKSAQIYIYMLVTFRSRMKRITIHLPTRGGGGSNEASESGAIVIARTMQIERDRDKRDAVSSGNGVRVSS